MKYEELLEILESVGHEAQGTDQTIVRLLSPGPLKTPEDLHRIISSRFRYTGPGKWVKILCDNTEK